MRSTTSDPDARTAAETGLGSHPPREYRTAAVRAGGRILSDASDITQCGSATERRESPNGGHRDV